MAGLRRILIHSGGLFLSVIASIGQTPPRQPQTLSARVCDIDKNPEHYDRKLVRVPASLVTGFEISALRDSEARCGYIWVATSDSTDSSLQNFWKYSSARLRNKPRPLDYGPPRYAINATFVGRLQYTHDAAFMVDCKNQVSRIRGHFGHLGQYKTQILLYSVADLHARDLLGSVYKTSEYEPYPSYENGPPLTVKQSPSSTTASRSRVCTLPTDEQEVIESFLADTASGATVAVNATESAGIDVDSINLQLAAEGRAIPAALRQDFKSKHTSECSINTKLKIKRVRFITREEYRRIFDKRGGWAEFHRRYGRSTPLVTLSRVGFNPERSLAMLYVTSAIDNMAGSAWIYTFRRVNRNWMPQAEFLVSAT